jgi:hypothetical protein
MKEEKKYCMLQLNSEIHTLLKDYCKKNNMIMGAYVASLIRKSIKQK